MFTRHGMVYPHGKNAMTHKSLCRTSTNMDTYSTTCTAPSTWYSAIGVWLISHHKWHLLQHAASHATAIHASYAVLRANCGCEIQRWFGTTNVKNLYKQCHRPSHKYYVAVIASMPISSGPSHHTCHCIIGYHHSSVHVADFATVGTY